MRPARISSLGIATASIVLLSALSLGAQEGSVKEPANNDPGTPAKKTYDTSRRVPPYYGQLGLTPEQKESVYKIRGKHQAKITALQKEITELRAAMLAECETVLTDSQKQQLQQRRQVAADRKKGTRTAATSTEPIKPVTP